LVSRGHDNLVNGSIFAVQILGHDGIFRSHSPTFFCNFKPVTAHVGHEKTILAWLAKSTTEIKM